MDGIFEDIAAYNDAIERHRTDPMSDAEVHDLFTARVSPEYVNAMQPAYGSTVISLFQAGVPSGYASKFGTWRAQREDEIAHLYQNHVPLDYALALTRYRGAEEIVALHVAGVPAAYVRALPRNFRLEALVEGHGQGLPAEYLLAVS